VAATLHHPNIVQMYDVGEVDGSYFISMEYLHGVDVRTLIRGMRERQEWIPLEHALNVVIGMSAGLHYAHEKLGFDGRPLGIVHRDINPHNVFITYDGAVKIVDFGIAKASNRFNETRAGTLKGKIPYMSPEQCRGESLDRRSDVFAIGIMLYELTTAYRLYKGKSEFEVLKKIVEGTITPPSQLRTDYPPSLEAIVLKALAKKRDERYQTACELQADLEAFARDHRAVISSIALSSYVQSLWPAKVEAWQEAQASGKDLAEHVAETAPSDPGRRPAPDEEDDDADADDRDEAPFETVTIAGTPRPRTRGDTGAGTGAGRTPTAHGEVAEPTETVFPARSRRGPWIAVAAVLLLVGAALLFASRGGTGRRAAVAAAAPDAAPVALATPAADAAPIAPATSPADAGPVAAGEPDAGAHVGHVKPHVGKPHSPPSAGPPGELRIASTPSCEVLVDGKARGATPLAGLMLPAGKHKVQLVNSRYKIDESYTVDVKSGEVTKRKFDFPTGP
jgi:hypothetical protein